MILREFWLTMMEERRVGLCMSQTNYDSVLVTSNLLHAGLDPGQLVAVEDVLNFPNILKTTALDVSISFPQLCHRNLETH
jgi:hypothetical protein